MAFPLMQGSSDSSLRRGNRSELMETNEHGCWQPNFPSKPKQNEHGCSAACTPGPGLGSHSGKRVRARSVVVDAIIALFAITIVILTTSIFFTVRYPLVGLPTWGLLSVREPVEQPLSPSPTPSVLDVFQVSPPVAIPEDALCMQTLMVHTFAFSYGQPFIGNYNPPSCDFNRVAFNLTVTSAGRQFDRLALMYFNDTEIFRTSTAEPTAAGIIWTYLKDMTSFLALFRKPQKIIFDLGNLIDDTYTGPFNTTLTATFWKEETKTVPADLILPISKRASSSNGTSAFSLPDEKASNTLTLPRNCKRAIFSVAANGQSTEEFWWSNVLSSNTQTFPDTELYGFSPFREVQLYIDGILAGVVWPFPIIFTGGVVPGFWRPVVGIDAFDLQEDEIDISAFLPLLSDGTAHTFEIRVAGISDDGKGEGTLTDTVGSYWVVTGKVFIWLDNATDHVTTGSSISTQQPSPLIRLNSKITATSNSTNTTLDYSVTVSRFLSHTVTLETSTGSHSVSWTQELSYRNYGNVTGGGTEQYNIQSTTGHDTANSADAKFSRSIDYPLTVWSVYAQDSASGNLTIAATMHRGKSVQIQQSGDSVTLPIPETQQFEQTSLSTTQNGTANYLSVPAIKQSFSWGSTEQVLNFNADQGDVVYKRHVVATNGTVVIDDEAQDQRLFGQSVGPQVGVTEYAVIDLRRTLGRGPH